MDDVCPQGHQGIQDQIVLFLCKRPRRHSAPLDLGLAGRGRSGPREATCYVCCAEVMIVSDPTSHSDPLPASHHHATRSTLLTASLSSATVL